MTLIAFPAPPDAAGRASTGDPAPRDAVARIAALDAAPRRVHRSVAMGGRLELHASPERGPAATDRELDLVARRVRAWAAILTRHDPTSPLMRLNDDARPEVPVGPTLAAALRWGRDASALTGGAVDIALLDARLRAEAETLAAIGPRHVRGPWSVAAGGRHGAATVTRAPALRFDLDGVGKGWLADRALGLLHPAGALVDADGDIAVRAAPGDRWEIGVGDPRDDDVLLAVVELAAGPERPRSYGVATSGTSVHRWGRPAENRHHLIDPRTGAPAGTEVVQATVIAATAREAEAWAKAIVILGASAGLDLVDRSDALGAIVLLGDGRTVALPRTSRLLA